MSETNYSKFDGKQLKAIYENMGFSYEGKSTEELRYALEIYEAGLYDKLFLLEEIVGSVYQGKAQTLKGRVVQKAAAIIGDRGTDRNLDEVLKDVKRAGRGFSGSAFMLFRKTSEDLELTGWLPNLGEYGWVHIALVLFLERVIRYATH